VPPPSSQPRQPRQTRTRSSPAPKAGREFDRSLLSARELARLLPLTTPAKIQDFITDRLSCNHEVNGDTVLSVRSVLREKHAHCIEAAFVAACCLWLNGEPPLLLDLHAEGHDYDHVVAVFRRNGCWGALSKSNHLWYRWRDPVYRSLRELAMSYFHEYVNAEGTKTLRSVSVPLDLSRVDPALWITSPDHCWEIVDRLGRLKHTRLLPPGQRRWLRPRDRLERSGNAIVEYPE
jgi:hypothetical protein